jgi:hypothetical protein
VYVKRANRKINEKVQKEFDKKKKKKSLLFLCKQSFVEERVGSVTE